MKAASERNLPLAEKRRLRLLAANRRAELRLRPLDNAHDYLGGPGPVDRCSHRGFVIQSRHIADACLYGAP